MADQLPGSGTGEPALPLIGAVVAVVSEWVLRGKATKAGADAAQGFLDHDNTTAR